MTDVALLWANREEFHTLCQECPEFLALVQHDCLLEVRRMLNRMESFAFRHIEERLAFTILDESRRQAANNEPLTELRITQQELAGLVGASRESVSRILSRFEQNGMVKTGRGRLIIRDRIKLQKVINR